jgi:hypothetical protein
MELVVQTVKITGILHGDDSTANLLYSNVATLLYSNVKDPAGEMHT